LRRVRTTIVVVGKQWVLHNLWMCVRSLRYPACNAHAPHFHAWPAPHYNIFPLYLTKGTIFEKKKLLNIKRVIPISPQFSSEIFFILRRTDWDMVKNVYWYSRKVPFILVQFNETWISSKDLRKKNLKYQISWTSIFWESNGRKDGQTFRS